MIVIGLLVEGLVFQTLERLTVQRWGMQRQALGHGHGVQCGSEDR